MTRIKKIGQFTCTIAATGVVQALGSSSIYMNTLTVFGCKSEAVNNTDTVRLYYASDGAFGIPIAAGGSATVGIPNRRTENAQIKASQLYVKGTIGDKLQCFYIA